MKFLRLIVVSVSLLYCSCEQLKDITSSNEDQNKTSPITDISDAQGPEPSISNNSDVQENEIAAIPLPPSPPPETAPPEVIPNPLLGDLNSQPIQPEFSKELLAAVKNWQSIPKSVFPLSSVTIKQTVEFIAKDRSGQILARATKQAGDEGVALGVAGKNLVLSPSKVGNMRGLIPLEQTDFKQGVAYLFELRKKQKEEYEKRKLQISSSKTLQANQKNVNKDVPTASSEVSLFEDLPIPGDFGHGKFCICKECREKRLAMKD